MSTQPNWPLPTPGYGPEPRRSRGIWFSKLIAVLIPAVLALPYMPASVRSLLPESWRSHLPRVEFLGAGHGKADSTQVHESAAMTGGFSLDAPALEEPEEVVPAKPAHAAPRAHAHRAVRPVAQLPEDEAPDPEGVEYVPDHAVYMVPTRMRTEIQLASAPGHAERSDVARSDGAPGVGVAEKDWPLVCGQVVDAAGTTVEGAQVELESPRLTVTTDAHGRFCVACPPGDCVLHIDAASRGRATRILDLTKSVFDYRITLLPRP
jgi:hypothetical protein